MVKKNGTWGEKAQQRSKKRLEYFKKKTKEKTNAFRNQAISLLGGRCKRCAYNTDYRVLFVDHVNGGGTAIRRKIGQWKHFRNIIDEIKNGSNDYQLLCANCNWLKRYENNEHNQHTLRKGIDYER